MVKEKLLGFDAREPATEWGHLWDGARRDAFLLRPDVAAPLSVDTLVWPSVFDTGQGIGFSEPERERLHMAGFPIPLWNGPNVGLWENLDEMGRYLKTVRDDRRPYTVVAITWLSDHDLSDGGPYGPHIEPTVPAEPKPDWGFLGYDVADGSFVSGLSNCGYSPDEVAGLRERWDPELNVHHLFAEAEPAFRFRALADMRVPQHAPFFVYRLSLVSGA